MQRFLLLLTLALSIPDDTSDDFIPDKVASFVSIGCMVSGRPDPTPFAESQVFIKWDKDTKGWEYQPVMSRRDVTQGGTLKAIDDCIDWYKGVRKKIVEATKEKK